MEASPKRRIAILGSTGSIGTQALDVIGQHPDLFEVELLTANRNSRLLIEQARQFNPAAVVICDESLYEEVSAALDPLDINVFAGIGSVCDLMRSSRIDMVLTAMVGFSGLRPTLAAIEAGKAIALANKETLVAAGSLVTAQARKYGVPILPVDSEHSAIFQCLQGEHATLEKILLTGSGGPFRHSTREEMAAATREQALNHPRWKMGAKVTIDSASLMNKGLELIEARWLFNVDPKDIEVVIHPQSIIHSMVQFSDGCVMAQLSQPDMRLAYESLERGGNATCTMNGANEVAVAAFLEGKIRFTDIPEIVATVLSRGTFLKEPGLEDIYSTDFEAKRLASELVNRH